MARIERFGLACSIVMLLATQTHVSAQSFGVDLHNALHPASGGLAGTSFAAPQDAPSALFGNPATLTHFEGATFSLGGAFVEPTLSVSHDGFVTRPLGGGPWQGKSEAEPLLLPNAAVIQDLRSYGIPGTVGLGVTALSGSATSFRHQPNSVGTSWEYVLPALNAGIGIEVGERLSLGATVTVGFGLIDTGFARSSAATHDTGVRGTIGANYDLPMDTVVGAFYQTKMGFEYDNLLGAPNGVFQNVRLDQPSNIGAGIANRSLLCGNLLLAADAVYKLWDDAAFWQSLYKNQWAFSAGAQYSLGRVVLRAGYAYADDPIRSNVGINVGGVAIGADAVRYLQATQAASICKHRITSGVGVRNVLPNVDLDLFLGAQFREVQDFGPHTRASVTVWYTGFGLTWHFGCKPACDAIATETVSNVTETMTR